MSAVSVMSERLNRSRVLVGRTQAFEIAIRELRDAALSEPAPSLETLRLLNRVASSLREQTQAAAAECETLAALCRAEFPRQRDTK